MSVAPMDPNTANSLGMQALGQQDFAAAERYFELATAADPNAVTLWLNLATACREQSNDKGERAALEGALNADRADFAAWYRLARLHERLSNEAEAFKAWSAVTQLAQQFGQIDANLQEIVDHAAAFVSQRQKKINAAADRSLSSVIFGARGAELRRATRFIDVAAGRARVYQNECSGLYYPFLPADEFFDDEHFPWFEQFNAAAPAIREELLQLLNEGEEVLRPYVRLDKGTPTNKWSPLDHRLDWGACFLWEYGKPNRAILERCPRTAEALQLLPMAEIPNRAPNAFFSLLKPHTRIPPHTGVSNTRAIVHLPLIVPEKCGFRVGGETRSWVEGQAFAFDDTIEHEAWNESDELRAILIIDVWNPHLTKLEQEVISEYYAAVDAAGLKIEPVD